VVKDGRPGVMSNWLQPPSRGSEKKEKSEEKKLTERRKGGKREYGATHNLRKERRNINKGRKYRRPIGWEQLRTSTKTEKGDQKIDLLFSCLNKMQRRVWSTNFY